MTNDELIKRLEVVTIKLGDTLVLTAPMALSQEAQAHIGRIFHDVFGEGVKLLILDAGLTLDVLREEEPENPCPQCGAQGVDVSDVASAGMPYVHSECSEGCGNTWVKKDPGTCPQCGEPSGVDVTPMDQGVGRVWLCTTVDCGNGWETH